MFTQGLKPSLKRVKLSLMMVSAQEFTVSLQRGIITIMVWTEIENSRPFFCFSKKVSTLEYEMID